MVEAAGRSELVEGVTALAGALIATRGELRAMCALVAFGAASATILEAKRTQMPRKQRTRAGLLLQLGVALRAEHGPMRTLECERGLGVRRDIQGGRAEVLHGVAADATLVPWAGTPDRETTGMRIAMTIGAGRVARPHGHARRAETRRRRRG